jgi:hypothetical protein
LSIYKIPTLFDLIYHNPFKSSIITHTGKYPNAVMADIVFVPKIPLTLTLSHKGRGNVTPPILPLDKGRSEEGLLSPPLMVASGDSPRRGGDRGEGEIF